MWSQVTNKVKAADRRSLKHVDQTSEAGAGRVKEGGVVLFLNILDKASLLHFKVLWNENKFKAAAQDKRDRRAVLKDLRPLNVQRQILDNNGKEI